MTRSNIQHDVVQLLDKYTISEILDMVMDVAADDLIHEMRMWFNKEFGNDDRLESALDKDVVDYVTHELEHHNARLVNHNMRLDKLERAIRLVSREAAAGETTPEDNFDEKISKEIVNGIVKKLNEMEKETTPRGRGEINR